MRTGPSDGFVDLALAAERGIDRCFWLHAAADEITAHADGDLGALVAVASRRIHATHRVSYRERCAALRVLVGRVAPLDWSTRCGMGSASLIHSAQRLTAATTAQMPGLRWNVPEGVR